MKKDKTCIVLLFIDTSNSLTYARILLLCEGHIVALSLSRWVIIPYLFLKFYFAFIAIPGFGFRSG